MSEGGRNFITSVKNQRMCPSFLWLCTTTLCISGPIGKWLTRSSRNFPAGNLEFRPTELLGCY